MNARESAILYVSAIIFFLTMPFIAALIKSFGKMPREAFMILIVVYSLLIFFFNKRYFENAGRIRQMGLKFGGESLIQKRIGYCVVIALALISFILFFFFLSIL